MAAFSRPNPAFALCGLNCCLCPRFHADGVSRCPGCGGEGFSDVHPTCAVASCSKRHDDAEYCFRCGAYPCERYERESERDSFITYRKVRSDLREAEADLEGYLGRLGRRYACLTYLLENFNDGRSKGLYCLAANLLPLDELESAVAEAKASGLAPNAAESARSVAALLKDKAKKANIELKLRK